MSKYHYSPITGKMERCSNPENCRYGGAHFENPNSEEAMDYMDQINSKEYDNQENSECNSKSNQIIKVEESRRENFLKKIEKYKKIMNESNTPFHFEEKEPEIIEGYKFYTFDVNFNLKEQENSVVAILDHKNNTIQVIDKDITIPEKYLDLENSTCEHCNSTRKRSKTILVSNFKTGEIKRIGSSCIDKYVNGNLNEKLNIYSYILGEQEYIPPYSAKYTFNTKDILKLAYDSIQEYGYTPTSEKDSTYMRVMEYTTNKNRKKKKFDNVDYDELVNDIISYYESNTDNSSYILNVKQGLKQESLCAKQLGFIVSCVQGYIKHKEKEEKLKLMAEEKKALKIYDGQVGDKLKDVKIIKSKPLYTYESQYGTTTLYELRDNENRVWHWKTTNGFDVDTNDKIVSFSVKDFNKYKDEDQCIITRLRVTNEVKKET